MTSTQITRSTAHTTPTREQADLIVRFYADQYREAECSHEPLEDVDQFVRAAVSPALHADVRVKDFEDVLEAYTEVADVEDDTHEQLQVNSLATVNNKPELLDAKMQELDFCIRYLLDYAGFGISRAAA